VNRDEKTTQLIRDALNEDIGSGDATTEALLDGTETGTARAVAKQNDLVIAGIGIFRDVFLIHDPSLRVTLHKEDGDKVRSRDVLAEISGSLQSIITAERVALNFFQHLSGIATATHAFVEKIIDTDAVILDTRKTLPGMRLLEKYAVTMGGGRNHRFGLYDAIMIKDNHISAAGSVSGAVETVRNANPRGLKIEVEVKTLEELDEVLLLDGIDIVMLDNMPVAHMREAVTRANRRFLIEASGNVSLSNVRDIAETGVDYISVGAITHSAPAADISLLIEGE